jgi:hypothetical protein
MDAYFNGGEFTSAIHFPYYYTVDSSSKNFVKNGMSTRPEEQKE